jgi:hypothetical protein
LILPATARFDLSDSEFYGTSLNRIIRGECLGTQPVVLKRMFPCYFPVYQGIDADRRNRRVNLIKVGVNQRSATASKA